jgi:hypothetical protein
VFKVVPLLVVDGNIGTFPSRGLPMMKGVTTQDFVKVWGNFFALVLLEMIEISQGFKTF